MIIIVYGKEALNEIPYGFPCPVELAIYEDMVNKVADNVPTATNALIHEWVMLFILQERQLKLNALRTDITREICGRKELSLSYRYLQFIDNRIYELIKELKTEQGP